MQKLSFKNFMLCATLLIAFVSCSNKKTCPICMGQGTMNTEVGVSTCPACDGEKKVSEEDYEDIMENLERYFIDPEEEIALLKDVNDNWNTDMTLAIEKAAIDYNCTNRQVLRMLPLDKLVDYFIYSKIIRDIKKYDFIEDHFNKNWLDSCGRE